MNVANAAMSPALLLAALLAAATTAPLAQTVTPVQENFGNIGPTLTYQAVDVFRSAGAAPWYVRFDLMTQSNVALGALGLTGGFGGTAFDLTSIRLVTATGANVAFGSDTFPVNPFPDPIQALVSVQGLPAGSYALEVSGSGDRFVLGGDASDFAVRLQVTADATGSGLVEDVMVLPARAAFGNVFPVLNQQTLEVARNGNVGPTYVSFNLLAQADVTLGVTGLVGGFGGTEFNLHAIRLVNAGGQHLAFGTDTFVANPFTTPTEQLVHAGLLTPGAYLLEVSGSGDRFFLGGDATDFAVNLRVAVVPEVGTPWLWLAGSGLLAWLARRRKPC